MEKDERWRETLRIESEQIWNSPEQNGDSKKLPRKLESIKASSFAMVASEFFAITRCSENFDEPFHNSRALAHAINRRHPCAPVGSHHQQCRATDALNAVFECICRSCSIKISGWQINLTIERSPLNIARINSRRSGAVVDHHLGPEIWWVTWLAMDWEGGEMKGKRLMWWLLADCCKAAKWELSQKHRVDDLINSRNSN